MFRIYDGREEFYQWDRDRKIIVDDASIKEVHFCNKTGPCSLVSEVYSLDELRVADVPNELLETSWRIHVYGYTGDYTKHVACFTVNARTKPEDYVHTDEELKTWEELEERVEALEQGGGGGSASEYTQPEWGSKQGKIQTEKYSEWDDYLGEVVIYLTQEEYDSVVSVYTYSYDIDGYEESDISSYPLYSNDFGDTYIQLYEGYVVIETEGETIKPIPAKYLEVETPPIMVVRLYTEGYDETTDTWSADKTPKEVRDALHSGTVVIGIITYDYSGPHCEQVFAHTSEADGYVVYFGNECFGYVDEDGWYGVNSGYALRKEADTE